MEASPGGDVARRAVITSDDVRQIIRCLQDASIDIWLDGGWGVDTLVGEETRPVFPLEIQQG